MDYHSEVDFSRREFLGMAPAGLAAQAAGERLDRRPVVERHNPVLRGFDGRSPLSVGNGEFAFTVDTTGLQTFPQLYDNGMPLCTLSQWGWHTAPGGAGTLRLQEYDTHGRMVGYPTSSKGQNELFDWLRENPHRLHLGRIGFAIDDPGEVSEAEQKLDLWSGILHSEFTWKGRRVVVETACHPAVDAVAVTVRGGPPVRIEFPYGSGAMNAADWRHPERHRSTLAGDLIEREMDGTRYAVRVGGNGELRQDGEHRFLLRPKSERLDFVVAFSRAGQRPTLLEHTAEASREYWGRFWSGGAALELPGCGELERRVVLSQYQTAIQCAGSLPPQETGLICNSWFGKFHLEMHYWHAAHFAVWGRAQLLERSLGWYRAILPSAREKARSQGYAGARWPKMTAPDGRDSPSPIGPLLIWQQPHPDRRWRSSATGRIRAASGWSGIATWCSNRRSSWPRTRWWDGRRVRARSAGDSGAGKPSPARDLESHLRAGVLGGRTGDGAVLARAAGNGAGSEVGGCADEAGRPAGEVRGVSGARELSADVHGAQSRPPVDAGGAGGVAGHESGSRNHAPDAEEGVRGVEVGGHLGLGFPDGGDDGGQPGRASSWRRMRC